MVEFRLLGPVEITADGRAADLGPPQRHGVLAALAVDAGRQVSAETLVARVWGEDAPDGARRALHAHVARIRRVLEQTGGAHLVRRVGGYVLEAGPEQVDVLRVRRLAERATAPGAAVAGRAALLREALELWRGEPLAGVSGPWAVRVRESWHRQYVETTVTWANAELSLGNHSQVLNRLHGLVTEHPLIEPLAAVLMRTLHAVGRTAEALDHYAVTRAYLAEELGTDPGAELRALHRALLRGELAAPGAVTVTAPGAAPGAVAAAVTGAVQEQPLQEPPVPRSAVPAQLPLGVPGFAGRGDQLGSLDAFLDGATDGPATRVIVLSGTAGVGKTSLAVHWARRAAEKFDDGQLYVNLRGFSPSGTVMSPAEAIRGFLDALDVPAPRIPLGLDAQIGLYRSLLANRRMLVVLDNARDADQIRPLLPGSPTAMVVVTSRDQLPSLLATEGARSLSLDTLSPAEARELLAARLGPARVAAEPDAVAEIICRCARLPLALVVAAARAAAHPDFRLAALADELRDARGGLDGFDGGDALTDVRAVLSWSYDTLGADAARLFRLLGLHPGPEVSAAAAASLAGVTVRQARQLLTRLTRAHLATERVSGRYILHDLLRVYAAELAHTRDTAEERHAAVRRGLDHVLHTAHAGDRLLDLHREVLPLGPPLPGVTPEEFAHAGQALDWFTVEHPVLLAALGQAAQGGFDSHVWQLAWALPSFFGRRGHWNDDIVTQRIAIAAARRLPPGPARTEALTETHRSLGRAHAHLGDYADALAHLRTSMELSGEHSDDIGRARALLHIAIVLSWQGHWPEALHHSLQALDVYTAAGHPSGRAKALNSVGWARIHLGEPREALDDCHEALGILRGGDHSNFEGPILDSIGLAHHHLGDHPRAISHYHQAIAAYQEFGDLLGQARSLDRLGDTHRAAGDPAAAHRAWRDCAELLESLSHPNAAAVRAKLAADPEDGRSEPTP